MHNQIFTKSKQSISSFYSDMLPGYAMFFTKSVKLELQLRVHLTSWIKNFPCQTVYDFRK